MAEDTLCGYAGRILRVNLTSQEIATEEPEPSFYRHYLGGGVSETPISQAS